MLRKDLNLNLFDKISVGRVERRDCQKVKLYSIWQNSFSKKTNLSLSFTSFGLAVLCRLKNENK